MTPIVEAKRGAGAPRVVSWIVLALGISLTGLLYLEALRQADRPVEARVLQARPLAILGAGLLVSGLLFGLIWSLAFVRFRAVAVARGMTASLRASEQRYGRLFEQSLAGIYRTAPEGQILECNEAFARLHGYESREDLLDHSAVELHESAESRQRFLEALREKGTLVARESRSRRKDGSLFWTLEHASLLPGPPEVIEGTIVDISERKEAEEALETARRYDGEIDLLLTDVVLPGMNGRRLADLLSPERPSMKVVFASGYFDERGILEPGSDFIQKPFNPETLARTIRRALDRKGPQPA